MTITAPRCACIALLTAVSMAALAACSSAGTGSPSGSAALANSAASGGAKGTVTIAYVPGVSPFPYFDTAYRGGAAEAEKYGYTLKYIGVSAYDPSTQAAALNAELAARPGFLLVSPDDNVALRPAIQRYIEAGIPVITVGGTLNDTQGLVSQIATDNAEGGRIVADYLGGTLGGKGTVAVTMPLEDRNGDPIAAVRVQMDSFFGETQDTAILRARVIAQMMQAQIMSGQDLSQ